MVEHIGQNPNEAAQNNEDQPEYTLLANGKVVDRNGATHQSEEAFQDYKFFLTLMRVIQTRYVQRQHEVSKDHYIRFEEKNQGRGARVLLHSSFRPSPYQEFGIYVVPQLTLELLGDEEIQVPYTVVTSDELRLLDQQLTDSE